MSSNGQIKERCGIETLTLLKGRQSQIFKLYGIPFTHSLHETGLLLMFSDNDKNKQGF